MEDQTRCGFQRLGQRWKAVIGGVGVLTLLACCGCSVWQSSPAWQAGEATRPDERTPAEYCVLDRRSQASGRVINYVDPEPCHRIVVQRSQTTVRVPPLTRPASTGQRGR